MYFGNFREYTVNIGNEKKLCVSSGKRRLYSVSGRHDGRHTHLVIISDLCRSLPTSYGECRSALDPCYVNNTKDHLVFLLQFVAHPSCQQRLDKSWYQGIDPFLKAGIIRRIGMILLFVIAYPFLTLLYVIIPKSNYRVSYCSFHIIMLNDLWR